MQYNSRLSQKQNQKAVIQIVSISIATIAILVLFFVFGLPWLFNLSGQLISMRSKGTTTTDKSLAIVATPSLFSDFVATPSTSIKIKGSAETGDNITIFLNGSPSENSIADSDGKFEIDVQLSSGDNKFTAQATDKQGNKSAMSEILTIRLLNKPPKLEVDQPKENQSFSNTDSVQISGTTDPNVTVTVNGRSTIVGADGKFSYFYRLSKGENNLKFEAIDLAGNKTTKEFKVTSD